MDLSMGLWRITKVIEVSEEAKLSFYVNWNFFLKSNVLLRKYKYSEDSKQIFGYLSMQRNIQQLCVL